MELFTKGWPLAWRLLLDAKADCISIGENDKDKIFHILFHHQKGKHRNKKKKKLFGQFINLRVNLLFVSLTVWVQVGNNYYNNQEIKLTNGNKFTSQKFYSISSWNKSRDKGHFEKHHFCLEQSSLVVFGFISTEAMTAY